MDRMTVYDLCCDRCGVPLTGPEGTAAGSRAGIRFLYHPGRAEWGDDAGLLCRRCWDATVVWFGERNPDACSRCRTDLRTAPSLFVHHHGDLSAWRLCRDDAVEFLNTLRTVDPKLDPATFRLPQPPPPDTSVTIRR
jgi:hypothetical protein